MTWKPLHFFAVALAGWMNRQQQDAIEYLRRQNRILREKLGHKRLGHGIRRECLNKMILLSEKHVRYVIQSFAEHYNKERPHKALNYCRPVEPDDPLAMEGVVKCHERLGGLLKSYCRQAA